MEGFYPILIGASAVLALSAVGVMAILQPQARAQFVYAQLCVMVGIYVGFAIAELDGADFITRSDWSPLLIESALGLGFLFGGLAILRSARVWMLGLLVLGHGGVDLAHLLIDGAAGPDWYAFACILYDAIVGVAAVVMLSDRAPARPDGEPPVL